jgi:hypothetical protein
MRNGLVLTYGGYAMNCSLCRANRDTLLDMLGTPICKACLRRIDADPREKRLLMFASQDAVYS